MNSLRLFRLASGLSCLILLAGIAQAQAPSTRTNGSAVVVRSIPGRAPVLGSPRTSVASIKPITKTVLPRPMARDWSTGRSVPLAKPWMRPLNP